MLKVDNAFVNKLLSNNILVNRLTANSILSNVIKTKIFRISLSKCG